MFLTDKHSIRVISQFGPKLETRTQIEKDLQHFAQQNNCQFPYLSFYISTREFKIHRAILQIRSPKLLTWQ